MANLSFCHFCFTSKTTTMTALTQLLLLNLLLLSFSGGQCSSTISPDADDDPFEYYTPMNKADITSPELQKLVKLNDKGDQW